MSRSVEILTVRELEEWIAKQEATPNIGEWKRVGREFRDEFGLTDMQALNLLREKRMPDEL